MSCPQTGKLCCCICTQFLLQLHNNLTTPMKTHSITLIVALFGFCGATWYFKEAKVCDPKQGNFIPFTGFKISRMYKVSGLVSPMSMSFLSITHCDHDKVDYESVIQTNGSTDIDWDRPFCFLKPGRYPLSHEKRVPAVLLSKQIGTAKNPGMNARVPEIQSVGPHAKLKPNKVKSGLANLLISKIDKHLEKISDGSWIDYTGKTSYNHLLDVQGADPQSSLESEARNLVCFKMARRRKYARRNVTFYMPSTFVGGLFECPVSREKRQMIFQEFRTNDFMESLVFECDPSIAKPISPLIAEDITKLWFDAKLGQRMNPALVQTIPYLSTSTAFNLRFSSSDAPDTFSNTWASKIDVNENYSYDDSDLNLISQAVAASANYLHKLISPPNIDHLITPSGLGSVSHDFTESPLATKEMISESMESFSWDQKLSLIFAKYDEFEASKHLKVLQSFWKNLE